MTLAELPRNCNPDSRDTVKHSGLYCTVAVRSRVIQYITAAWYTVQLQIQAGLSKASQPVK